MKKWTVDGYLKRIVFPVETVSSGKLDRNQGGGCNEAIICDQLGVDRDQSVEILINLF